MLWWYDMDKANKAEYKHEADNGQALRPVGSWKLLFFVMVIFSLGGSALGQIQIQPMKLDLQPYRREVIKETFTITNSSEDEAKTLEIMVIDLSQEMSGGGWDPVMPTPENAAVLEPDPNADPAYEVDVSKLSSCKDWISLSDTEMEIGRLEVKNLTMTLKVPASARGFYGAAILVSTKIPPDATGLAMRIRFLIPILVEVQGPAMRHNVQLTDVGMEFRPASGDMPATTAIWMEVENNGGKYCKLIPLVRLRTLSAGHWQEVTKLKLKNSSIIPGVKFILSCDLERSLPSGKYEVSAVLYVDGRRVKGLEEEIDFVGDPMATKAALDAALLIRPVDGLLECTPGRLKSNILNIYNASDDTVNVKATVGLAPGLMGVSIGELRGVDLSCADWITINPDKFTLRGGQQRTVRIIARMPELSNMRASYYAQLQLNALYADKQTAGTSTANICISNMNVESVKKAQATKLSIALMEGSRYIVLASFTNTGDIYFEPKCTAALSSAEGASMSSKILRQEGSGVMLPLETREFSEMFNFSGYAAGIYRLAVILEYAPNETAIAQMPVRVTLNGDRRVVEAITTSEYEATIGARWSQ